MPRRRKPERRRRRPKPPRHAPRKTAAHACPRTKPKRRRSPYRAGTGRGSPTVGRAEVDRLGAALAAEPDVVRGLERLLTVARRVTAAEAGTVYLRRGEALEFAAVQNDALARQLGEEEVRRRVGARPLSLRENSIAGYVMATRATVNLRDAYAVPVDRPYTLFREVDRKADYRTRSMLALPLRDRRRRVVGVLQLINALDRQGEVRAFSPQEQTLVQAMAAQTARLSGLAAD